MSAFVFTLAIFIFILCKDLIPAKRERDHITFYTGIALLAAGFIVLALASFNILVPSPVIPLEAFLRRLLGL